MEKLKKAWSWIILYNKKILLIKRSFNKIKYPWFRDIPWWRWEDNESYEEIAIREVKEEVWLDFSPESNFWESILWSYNCKRFLGSRSWTITLQKEEADKYARFTFDQTLNLQIAFDFTQLIQKLKSDWLID